MHIELLSYSCLKVLKVWHYAYSPGGAATEDGGAGSGAGARSAAACMSGMLWFTSSAAAFGAASQPWSAGLGGEEPCG